MRCVALMLAVVASPAHADEPQVVTRPWAITGDIGLHSHGTIGVSVERGIGRYLAAALGVGRYLVPTIDPNDRVSAAFRVRYPGQSSAVGLSAETWYGDHEAGRYREDTCKLEGAIGAGGTGYVEVRGDSGFVFRGSFGRTWIAREGSAPCTKPYGSEALVGLSFGGSF